MNDITLVVNDTKITGSDILSAIDEVIAHLEQTDDLEFVEIAIQNLMGIQKISGMGVAKLLNGVQTWWERTGQDKLRNDTFVDWAYGVSTEFNRTYIERCITVQQYTDGGTFSDRITVRPLKDQQAIASHLDQGYVLTEDEWEELEDAVDNSEVLAILRNAKGKPPRKHSLSISLDRNGSLTVWYQGVSYFWGAITLPAKAESAKEKEAFGKALKRLKKLTGVSEK